MWHKKGIPPQQISCSQSLHISLELALAQHRYLQGWKEFGNERLCPLEFLPALA